MKVTFEGTTEEILNLAELLVYGRCYRNSLEAPTNTDTTRPDVRDAQATDDVPNRYREEGVQ